jgi:hypothetical protein
MSSSDLKFDVFPKFVPEGKDSEVLAVLSKRPEVVVSLYRRLDFTYDSLELLEGDAHILTWTINGTVHQE